jgi:hypothetical protein
MRRGSDAQIDAVEFLLFDIEESKRVGLFFPEWTFAEGAIDADPWLRDLKCQQSF